jgi:hypothetical protein
MPAIEQSRGQARIAVASALVVSADFFDRCSWIPGLAACSRWRAKRAASANDRKNIAAPDPRFARRRGMRLARDDN